MSRTSATLTLAVLTPALGLSLAAPAQAAAPTACTGVTACTVVSRADVDGDGRRDSVGISWSTGSDGADRSTVRVLTADGERLSTTTADSHWRGANPWWGAAAINRRAGHELVVGDDMGNHGASFRVITYRSGALTTQLAPGGEYRWTIDSSNYANAGYWRTASTNGTIRLTRKVSSLEGELWTLSTRTYSPTWSDGWTKVSGSTIATTDIRKVKVGGWHVPYLDSYYG